MKVAVVGLGKLGSVLAAVLADAAHDVYGIDKNQDYVDSVNSGRPPVQETGLDELFSKIPREKLTATTDYSAVISHCEMSLIVVPTPSGPDGRFLNDYVLEAIEKIGENLGSSWHTVVVCSTVMPGSMETVIKPALEKAAGRTVGNNLSLVYSPEFIALGSVIRDMLMPDAVFIGTQEPQGATHLRCLIESYVVTRPEFHIMTYSEAELAKIAVNSYVTKKISYANMIAEFCERLPGASARSVLGAIGADSRIGKAYMSSGASFGGPCFPRDNRAMGALAAELHIRAELPYATDRINRHVAERICFSLLNDHNVVAVLGLSYKTNTSVVEESMGLTIATLLVSMGMEVRVHDPMAAPDLPVGAVQYGTVREALDGATAVVVATPWSDYGDIDFGGRQILDAWNITAPQENRKVLGDSDLLPRIV